MKAILNDKALRKLVEDFIANPDAGFPTISVIEKQKDGSEVIVKKPYGFTQKQQAILMVVVLTEAVFTEYTTEQFERAIELAYAMCNGSASRQCMEVANLLHKSETGKRGLDVQAMAKKYTSAFSNATE